MLCLPDPQKHQIHRSLASDIVIAAYSSRPGQMVSFDLLGPLPTTAKGNKYVFLVRRNGFI